MAAADFGAASCPRVRNEIKKTKLHGNTEPAADICTLLCAGASTVTLVWTCLKSTVSELLTRPVHESKVKLSTAHLSTSTVLILRFISPAMSVEKAESPPRKN